MAKGVNLGGMLLASAITGLLTLAAPVGKPYLAAATPQGGHNRLTTNKGSGFRGLKITIRQ